MSESQQDLVPLTPVQRKAFSALKSAMTRCAKAGIYLWDDSGTISAVNGKNVEDVCTDDRIGDELDRSYVETFSSRAWHGSNADDLLYVKLK